MLMIYQSKTKNFKLQQGQKAAQKKKNISKGERIIGTTDIYADDIFPNVSSKNWLERMHDSHIGCICSTYIKAGPGYWVGGKMLIINQSKPRLT